MRRCGDIESPDEGPQATKDAGKGRRDFLNTCPALSSSMAAQVAAGRTVIMAQPDGVRTAAKPASGPEMFMESMTLVRGTERTRFFDRRQRLMANSPSLAGRVVYSAGNSAPAEFWSWSLTVLTRNLSSDLGASRYLDYAEGFPPIVAGASPIPGQLDPMSFCDFMNWLRPASRDEYAVLTPLYRRYLFTEDLSPEGSAPTGTFERELELASPTDIDNAVADWFWDYFGGEFPTKRRECLV